MQGQVQLPKPTPEKPTKTIHLWRIHRELLEKGRVPPPDGMSSGQGTARDGTNAMGGTIKERTRPEGSCVRTERREFGILIATS